MVTLATGVASTAAAGCSGNGSPSTAGPIDAGGALLAEARRVLESAPTVTPPSRPELLALAQSIEACALLEPNIPTATDAHVTAAELIERAWRLDAQDQDAKEALLLYKKATRDPAVPRACEAGERAALLFGESTHDPKAMYRELYRARGRVGGDAANAACGARIDAHLATLLGLRPPTRDLEALDRGDDAGNVLATTALPTTQLVRLEAWPGEDASRIVFVLDGASPHVEATDRPATATTPAEISFDFPGAGATEIPMDTKMSGIVTRVRVDASAVGARITLELAAAAHRRVFHLLEPYRVVVDVARAAGQSASARPTRRVVLDPGHGGIDPGAIGATGTKEKDVTLDIARRVGPALAAQGIEAVLTRDDDRAVSLEERTGRANAADADLFVSIHCNAAESRDRHGVETYVLDTANDAIAGRIASRENATSQAANAELGAILSSMRIADQSTRSVRFAHLLQTATLQTLREDYPDTKDGGVHNAGFYVLVGARMPGVLFETSYLSNPSDEERLASDGYRQEVALAIASAIVQYRDGR